MGNLCSSGRAVAVPGDAAPQSIMRQLTQSKSVATFKGSSRRLMGLDQRTDLLDIMEKANNAKWGGRYKPALGHYRKALAIREEIGSSISDTLSPDADSGEVSVPQLTAIMLYIGECLDKLGKHEEAMDSNQRAVEIREEQFGTDHIYTAEAYSLLAESCNALHLYDTAIRNTASALKIREANPDGGKNAGTARCMAALGTYHGNRGDPMRDDYEEALKFLNQAHAMRQEILESSHPDIGDTLNRIGQVHESHQKYPEALENFELALDKRREEHMYDSHLKDKNGETKKRSEELKAGVKHGDVAMALVACANVRVKKGDTTHAISEFNDAIDMYRAVTKSSPGLAAAYEGLSGAYVKRKDFTAAFSMMEKGTKAMAAAWGTESAQVAALLYRTGDLCITSKSDDLKGKAVPILKRALRMQTDTLGPTHSQTLRTQLKLGEALDYNGHSDNALEFYQQIADAHRDDDVGATHINFADALQNMGRIYFTRKDFENALEYYEKALPVYVKHAGKDSADVAKLSYNLGQACKMLKDFEMAHHYLETSMMLYDKNPEFGDAKVLGLVAFQLGSIFEKMDNLEEAVKYMVKSYKAKESFAETSGRQAGTAAFAVARLYRKLESYEEAIEYYRTAKVALQKADGLDSDGVITVLSAIAETYIEMDDKQQAITLYEEVAKIKRDAGHEDEKLAQTYHNIGVLNSDIGNHEEAAKHHRMSTVAHRSIVNTLNTGSNLVKTSRAGANDDAVWQSMLHAGLALAGTKQYEEATKELESLLDQQIATDGPMGPRLLNTYTALASTYAEMGKYDQAVRRYKLVLQIQEKDPEGNEEAILRSVYNLGVVSDHNDDPKTAIEYFGRALEMHKKKNSTGEMVATISYTMANLLKKDNRPEEALTLFWTALEVFEELLGKKDDTVAQVHYAMGECFEAANKMTEAVGSYFKCQNIWEVTEGEFSNNVGIVCMHIGEAMEKQSEFGDALPWFEKAAKIFNKVLGPEDKNTTQATEKAELMKWRADD